MNITTKNNKKRSSEGKHGVTLAALRQREITLKCLQCLILSVFTFSCLLVFSLHFNTYAETWTNTCRSQRNTWPERSTCLHARSPGVWDITIYLSTQASAFVYSPRFSLCLAASSRSKKSIHREFPASQTSTIRTDIRL